MGTHCTHAGLRQGPARSLLTHKKSRARCDGCASALGMQASQGGRCAPRKGVHREGARCERIPGRQRLPRHFIALPAAHAPDRCGK